GAMTKVSSGPTTTSTPTITTTTWVTSVRVQPGQEYQPRYSAPSMSDSAQALPLRCNPNALNLNFTAVFSTNRRPIEACSAHSGENCRPRHMTGVRAEGCCAGGLSREPWMGRRDATREIGPGKRTHC